VSRRRYVDSRKGATWMGIYLRAIPECEHCDGERGHMVREDRLRGHICPDCDSSLDEMFGEGPYAKGARP
jgi:Zn finger protein HypA/HybF involved in hydrogenase expression